MHAQCNGPGVIFPGKVALLFNTICYLEMCRACTHDVVRLAMHVMLGIALDRATTSPQALARIFRTEYTGARAANRAHLETSKIVAVLAKSFLPLPLGSTGSQLSQVLHQDSTESQGSMVSK